jgi:ATP-dependent DNA ligase
MIACGSTLAAGSTGRTANIVEALRSLPVRSIVIDGEAVVCGKDGKSDFDKLHSGTHDASVFLYGFDLERQSFSAVR